MSEDQHDLTGGQHLGAMEVQDGGLQRPDPCFACESWRERIRIPKEFGDPGKPAELLDSSYQVHPPACLEIQLTWHPAHFLDNRVQVRSQVGNRRPGLRANVGEAK